MSATVLYMSMSLDGFIAGPDETPDNPLGDGGYRLHDWSFPGDEGGVNRQIHDEFMSTGAVVAGRGTFEPAGGWDGDHHGGVPIYILSRHPAPDWPAPGHARYVTDGIESCVRQAQAAAGGRDVLVHGAATAQRALSAGLLDELEIHLIPVLLGGGRRLFDHLRIGQRELDRTEFSREKAESRTCTTASAAEAEPPRPSVAARSPAGPGASARAAEPAAVRAAGSAPWSSAPPAAPR